MSTRPNRFTFSRSAGSANRPYGRSTRGGYSSYRNYKPQNRLGDDITRFIKKAAEITPYSQFIPQNSFADFLISDILKQNIKNLGYSQPTQIQDQAIEPILSGQDLIGLAATGTGKTAAFLIPILDKLYKDKSQKAVIIAPTRELALQINDELHGLARGMQVYSTIIIGGANMNRQVFELRRNPQVVIATPGRLKDLINRKIIYLEDYATFVLDEVDLMVDIGFIGDIKFFISYLPQKRQSLFFSATISSKVTDVLRTFVNDNPVQISVKKQETSENVEQNVIHVTSRDKKVDQLHDLLIQDGFDKVLIFGRTKHGVEKLNRELTDRGFKTGAIHGNKTQGHRQKVLASFKQNNIKILLATDVASRGLDIDNVSHVINYDLPETYQDYIHRIGRTGRLDKKGIALTFVE